MSGTRRLRLAFFGELLAPPFDEGIKNSARHLIRAWREQHELLALTTRGADLPELGLRSLPADALLRGEALHRELRDFRPDAVLYLPTAAATLGAFLRAATLRRVSGAPVVLVAVQPRRYGALARLLMARLQPARTVVATGAMARTLGAMGVRAQVLPTAGVALDHFAPPAPGSRPALRQALGWPADRPVWLHVGHVKAKRNLDWLLPVVSQGHVVVVGSSSTQVEGALLARLRAGGVEVRMGFQPNLAQLFQAADGYLFPVTDETGAIALPLSVLEALASDLPVISTPFGALPDLLPPGGPIAYVESVDTMLAALGAHRPAPGSARAAALAFGWEAVAAGLAERLAEVADDGQQHRG